MVRPRRKVPEGLRRIRPLPALATALLLGDCGGGSGGSTTPAPGGSTPPAVPPATPNGAGETAWARYDGAQDNHLVLEGGNVRMESGLRTARFNFWDALLPGT